MASCRLATCSPGFQQLSVINMHASEQHQPSSGPRVALMKDRAPRGVSTTPPVETTFLRRLDFGGMQSAAGRISTQKEEIY
jgi:hypothetical protein